MCKVSFLIPAYNSALFLENCVFSLLNQKNTAYEILIANDGSTDNTKEIAELLVKKNKNIRFFNSEHRGVSAIRQLLLEEAKGDYISYIDSDDFVSDTFLSMMNTDYRYDIYICGFDSKGVSNPNIDGVVDIRSFLELYFGDFSLWGGSLCNKIIKKSLFDSFDSFSMYEDSKMILSIIAKNPSIYSSSKLLYKYTFNHSSITHNCINSFEKLDNYIELMNIQVLFCQKKGWHVFIPKIIENGSYNLYCYYNNWRFNKIKNRNKAYKNAKAKFENVLKINKSVYIKPINKIMYKMPRLYYYLMRINGKWNFQ